MGLFDAFSGSDEFDAARNAANRNLQGTRRANRILDRSLDEQRQLYKQAGKGQRRDYRRAGKPLKAAAKPLKHTNVVQPYVQAYNTGDRALGQAGDRGDLLLERGGDQAIDYFTPLAHTYNRGVEQYADAMGVNGQEGYDQAGHRFHTSPGYEFQVDQGLDALERRASARGQLGSGNLSADTMQYMQGLADQEWDDYLNNLSGYNALATDVAGRMGDIRTGTAAARAGLGKDVAGLRSALGMDYATGRTGAELAKAGALADLATRRSDLRSRLALANSGLASDYIGGLRDVRAQQAGNLTDNAQTVADIIAQGQMAGSQAGMNQLAALLGIGQVGASVFGAMG